MVNCLKLVTIMGIKPITIIISTYFKDVNELAGGLGERLVGLYGTYANRYKHMYNIYIYAENEKKLIKFESSNPERIYPNVSVFRLFNIIKELCHNNKCNIVVSWPYVSVKSLFLITLCKKMGCKIIIDVVDLPIEQQEAFEKRKSFYTYLYLKINTKTSFWISDSFFVASDEFKSVMKNMYHINSNILQVIPNGTFSDIIIAKEKLVVNDFITLVYCGSILEGKGISNIIKCVENVRRKGYNVILKLYGYNGMNLKSNDWLIVDKVKFSQMNDVLNEADILLMPYPKKFYYDIAHPIKLSDYMASGKPIICFDLKVSKEMIERFNCGIVCNDDTQIEDAIVELSNNYELRKKLGNNGRKAAVEFFDWSVLSDKMNEALVQLNKT